MIYIFKFLLSSDYDYRIQWVLAFVNAQGHSNFSSQNRAQLTCTCIVYVILIYVNKNRINLTKSKMKYIEGMGEISVILVFINNFESSQNVT